MKLNVHGEKCWPQSKIEYSNHDADWQNGDDLLKEITHYVETKS